MDVNVSPGGGVKNLVVWRNSAVAEHANSHGLDPCADRAAEYTFMCEVSQATARRYLRGDWQGITLTEPFADRESMFRANYEWVREQWHREPCNILFVDSDTVFLQPVEIFGEFREFRMFNWSTPKTHARYENYYNCAVRYFPAAMTEETWRVGDFWFGQWDPARYDDEQAQYNAMLWSQGLDHDQIHRPDLNFQAPELRVAMHALAWQDYNQCRFTNVKILHYHGTRGAQAAAQRALEWAVLAGVAQPVMAADQNQH